MSSYLPHQKSLAEETVLFAIDPTMRQIVLDYILKYKAVNFLMFPFVLIETDSFIKGKSLILQRFVSIVIFARIFSVIYFLHE